MGKNRRSGGGGGGESAEPTPQTQTFSDEEWEQVSTPEEIADLLGWDVEVERNKSGKVTSVKFHDPEHNMDVEFNALTSNNAKHLFDMENKGREAPDDELTRQFKEVGIEFERRNFRDVVRMVQELNDDQKNANPLILFDNKIMSAPAYGEHTYWPEERWGHATRIYGLSFIKNSNNPDFGGHSLERTLDHECNHGIDYMSSSQPNGSHLTGSGLSSNPRFVEAITKIGTGKNAITSNVGEYTKSKYKDNFDWKFREECYADAKSIVNMRNKGMGDQYVQLGDKSVVTVNQWCNKYPELVEIVEDMSASPADYPRSSTANVKPSLTIRHLYGM